MDLNNFKAKILEGHPVFGVVLRSPEVAFAELVGLTGFDFAWIDMEHSIMSLKQVETLIITLENQRCISLVRVSGNEADYIGKVLDMGADIVNVPHIETIEEAQQVVQNAKYFPVGRRGFSSCSRANKQGIDVLDKEKMQQKNNENMVMVQIESRKGMQNLDQIAQVEGIDILFLGLGDLSQDLGIPGQFQHSAIIEAINQFCQAVSKTGKIGAVPVADPDRINYYIDLGLRMICCGVDIILIKDALKRLMKNIHSRVKL